MLDYERVVEQVLVVGGPLGLDLQILLDLLLHLDPLLVTAALRPLTNSRRSLPPHMLLLSAPTTAAATAHIPHPNQSRAATAPRPGPHIGRVRFPRRSCTCKHARGVRILARGLPLL